MVRLLFALCLTLLIYHPTPAESRCVEYDGKTFCDGMMLNFVDDYPEFCRNRFGVENVHTYKAETARDFHMLLNREMTAREFIMAYSERMRNHEVYHDSLVMVVLASCGFFFIV